MRKLLILAVTLLSVLCAAPSDGLTCDGQGNGAPCCWAELLKVTSGAPMNQTIIDAYKGTESPINFWSGSGSQNIPVLCRAADYWKNGNPSWFEAYFNDQEVGGIAGGHQGSELLSPLYSPWVAAAVMTGLERATQLGHGSIQTKARRWLRTYWALHTLAAHPQAFTSITSVQETGTHTDPFGNAAVYEGLTTPVAGMRRLAGTSDPEATDQANLHVGQFLLSLALGWQPRRLDYDNLGTDEYYNALRLAVHLAGGQFNKDGTLDFAAVPAPVGKFGLTSTERQTLRSFIADGGATLSLLQSALSMIPHGAKCAMTFLRTSAGTSVWFGDDTGEVARCNNNKAPWFGVTMSDDGGLDLLTPDRASTVANAPLVNRSRRSGSRIEAWATSQPQTTYWIDLIPGATVFKVAWRSNGPVLLQHSSPPLPNVSIVATDSSASEGPNNTGQFSLTRSGSTAAPLTVNLTSAGSAIPGSDYTSISTPRTFGINQGTLLIPVSPINDTAIESEETVVLTVAAGTGYLPGSPASGTVTITNDDYTPCASGGTRLCLASGRFEVTLSATANGSSYPGQVIGASNSSGAFWLFSPDNVEVGVKIVDGSSSNGNFWLYHGAATDLAYTLTVKDLANPSRIKTYSKPAGSFCGGADAAAFVRSAGAGPSLELEAPTDLATRTFSCTANATTACLLGNRFQVRLRRGTVYESLYGATANTAGFWFVGNENLEALVKVIDGTSFNGKYWVYFGSLTSQAYTVEVRDSLTEVLKSYSRTAAQAYCGGGDTTAF